MSPFWAVLAAQENRQPSHQNFGLLILRGNWPTENLSLSDYRNQPVGFVEFLHEERPIDLARNTVCDRTQARGTCMRPKCSALAKHLSTKGRPRAATTEPARSRSTVQ